MTTQARRRRVNAGAAVGGPGVGPGPRPRTVIGTTAAGSVGLPVTRDGLGNLAPGAGAVLI